MILMMLMTNFENPPNRKNDKSCCVHKRNNWVESVDCILRSPTVIVAMLNDRTAELIGQSENHYSTVFLT